MKKTRLISSTFAAAALAVAMTQQAGAVNLVTNGDWETGDTTGWNSFPTSTSTFTITSDAHAGNFAAELFNDATASAALIKQENLGAGLLAPEQEITISFWAKGSAEVGGVHFVEFFSLNAVGGVTKGEILGGAPLFPSATEYTFYQFTTTAAADVDGGVTLQIGAITGAAGGSNARLFIDNISVSADVIPEPSGALLLLSGLGLMAFRRQR